MDHKGVAASPELERGVDVGSLFSLPAFVHLPLLHCHGEIWDWGVSVPFLSCVCVCVVYEVRTCYMSASPVEEEWEEEEGRDCV